MSLLLDLLAIIFAIICIIGIVWLMGIFTKDDDYGDPTNF
jgi:hypothetical protein